MESMTINHRNKTQDTSAKRINDFNVNSVGLPANPELLRLYTMFSIHPYITNTTFNAVMFYYVAIL